MTFGPNSQLKFVHRKTLNSMPRADQDNSAVIDLSFELEPRGSGRRHCLCTRRTMETNHIQQNMDLN